MLDHLGDEPFQAITSIDTMILDNSKQTRESTHTTHKTKQTDPRQFEKNTHKNTEKTLTLN